MPKEVIVAKVLHAVIATIELCIAAAALPAAIPMFRNPMQLVLIHLLLLYYSLFFY